MTERHTTARVEAGRNRFHPPIEPLPAMKLQCKTGLRWLRQCRIQGIIFLDNTTLDLGFESVDWTCEWIRSIGDNELRKSR